MPKLENIKRIAVYIRLDDLSYITERYIHRYIVSILIPLLMNIMTWMYILFIHQIVQKMSSILLQTIYVNKYIYKVPMII